MKNINKKTIIFALVATLLLAGVFAVSLLPQDTVAQADDSIYVTIYGPDSSSVYTQYVSTSGTSSINMETLKTRLVERGFGGFEVLGLANTQKVQGTVYSDYEIRGNYSVTYSDQVAGADGVFYETLTSSSDKTYYVMLDIKQITYDIEDSRDSFCVSSIRQGDSTTKAKYVIALCECTSDYGFANLEVLSGRDIIDNNNITIYSKRGYVKKDTETAVQHSSWFTYIEIPVDYITDDITVSASLEKKAYEYVVTYNESTPFAIYGLTDSGNRYIVTNRESDAIVDREAEDEFPFFTDLNILCDAIHYVNVEEESYFSAEYTNSYTITFGEDLNADGKITESDEIAKLPAARFGTKRHYIPDQITIKGGIRFTNTINMFDGFAFLGGITVLDDLYIKAPIGICIYTHLEDVYIGDVTFDVGVDQEVIVMALGNKIHGSYNGKYYSDETPIQVFSSNTSGAGESGSLYLVYNESMITIVNRNWYVNCDSYIERETTCVLDVIDDTRFEMFSGRICCMHDEEDDQENYLIYNEDYTYKLEKVIGENNLYITYAVNDITVYNVIDGVVSDYQGTDIASSYNAKDGYVLPIQNPTMENYKFMGWYADQECTKAIKEIPVGQKHDQVIYAKWTMVSFSFKQPAGVTANYSEGDKHKIEIVLDDQSLDASYQWYKDSKDESGKLIGETKSYIEVSLMQESGTYYCYITVNYNGKKISQWSDLIYVNILEANETIGETGIDGLTLLIYCLVGAVVLITILIIVIIITKRNKKDRNDTDLYEEENALNMNKMLEHDAKLVQSIVNNIDDRIFKPLMTGEGLHSSGEPEQENNGGFGFVDEGNVFDATTIVHDVDENGQAEAIYESTAYDMPTDMESSVDTSTETIDIDMPEDLTKYYQEDSHGISSEDMANYNAEVIAQDDSEKDDQSIDDALNDDKSEIND